MLTLGLLLTLTQSSTTKTPAQLYTLGTYSRLKYTVLNKKKNHPFAGGKIQQTAPRKGQCVDLLDKDFKMTVLKMFEEFKKRYRESQENNVLTKTYYSREKNLNK